MTGPAPLSSIRTAHGFGYAFCGEATTLPTRATGTGSTLVLARVGQAALSPVGGEHVVGRDPDVEVRLDASTVSRRHARLVVTAEGTVLEDFGSKNGTFRGSERVTSPVQLADGDSIRIGSLLVTFHVRAPIEVHRKRRRSPRYDPGVPMRIRDRYPRSVLTRSSAGSVPAAWARSTARAIHGSGARWRSS